MPNDTRIDRELEGRQRPEELTAKLCPRCCPVDALTPPYRHPKYLDNQGRCGSCNHGWKYSMKTFETDDRGVTTQGPDFTGPAPAPASNAVTLATARESIERARARLLHDGNFQHHCDNLSVLAKWVTAQLELNARHDDKLDDLLLVRADDVR